jgi:hypothetical protein
VSVVFDNLPSNSTSNRLAMVLSVLGLRFGNHVGDWEHTMVRFINGTPSVVYYSQHSSGAAYTYSAAEKIGVRPVSYTGIGTHANYPVCLPSASAAEMRSDRWLRTCQDGGRA